MVRYFFCPPEVKIFHLKKLLVEKFELDESVQVLDLTPIWGFDFILDKAILLVGTMKLILVEVPQLRLIMLEK